MKGNPLFSIIIPTKNRDDLLAECLQSLSNQSFKDFEVLVIYEDSTQVFEKFDFEKLKLVRFIKNFKGERSAGRNLGLENSKGQYICFIDDDDMVTENFLLNFYDFLKNNNFPKGIILRTSYSTLANHRLYDSKIKYFDNKNVSPTQFALSNFLGLWTHCISSEIAKSEKFSPQFHFWEDTHYLVRIIQKSKFIQLDGNTYIYRIHEKMGSRMTYYDHISLHNIKNNIDCINDLFQNYGAQISELTQSLNKFLLAEKYMQYATKFILEKRYYLGFSLLMKSIQNGLHKKNWKYYLVFGRNLIYSLFKS